MKSDSPIVQGVGTVTSPPPAAPTEYTATLDPPAVVTLSWVNGLRATSVRHELSTDGGATWDRLDDDRVPTTTSDHSLPPGATVHLRAKSVNASGESAYTTPVIVVTSTFDP